MVEAGRQTSAPSAAASRVPPRPLGPTAEWPVPYESVEGQDSSFGARLQYWTVRAALATASRTPEFLLGPFLRGLARVSTWVDKRHTEAAREFLQQALGRLEPDELERRVRKAYEHLFRVVVESDQFVRQVPLMSTFEHFDFEICDAAWDNLEGEQGMVLITPHIGNWEVASVAVSRLGWQPLYAVAKPAKNAFVSRAMQDEREQRGMRILPRRGAMAGAPKVLAAGGTYGMLLDQRARTRPVMAPFFGRMARCDRSVGVLLKRLNTPLMFLACYRDEQRPMHFRFVIDKVVQPDEVRGLSSEAISTMINAEFERMIYAAPEQYFWIHDRFRDTPFEAAPAVADSDAPEPGTNDAPPLDA